jgi:Fe-S cluster biogenesis protein NfuA
VDVIVVEFNLLVKPDSGDYHTDATGGWAIGNSGISRFLRPAASRFSRMTTNDGDIRSRIEAVLDVVRETLARHGGGIDFVDYDGTSGCLSLRFTGMCAGCPMAGETLACIVEEAMIVIPEVRRVTAVNIDPSSHEV